MKTDSIDQPTAPEIVVIALGGNAILQAGQKGTAAEQTANIQSACQQIANIIEAGYRVVLTHGNGPQVGNLLIQSAAASGQIPPLPLDVLGAASQGQIGYMFQRELQNELLRRGRPLPVASVVTQVVVDPGDEAFAKPTKPVGPFYSQAAAAELMAATGHPYVEDAGRGWRRVVPSPLPHRVVEIEAIRALIDGGAVIIASGGGGVPVAATAAGLGGVEAVIDKDLAAAVLAKALGAHLLLILTDVPEVYIDYRKPTQRALGTITAAEAIQYQSQGHFHAGSMRTKVQGAVQFVTGGGRRAVIAALHMANKALAGKAGTQIVPDEPAR